MHGCINNARLPWSTKFPFMTHIKCHELLIFLFKGQPFAHGTCAHILSVYAIPTSSGAIKIMNAISDIPPQISTSTPSDYAKNSRESELFFCITTFFMHNSSPKHSNGVAVDNFVGEMSGQKRFWPPSFKILDPRNNACEYREFFSLYG